MKLRTILDKARELRFEGKIQESFNLVQEEFKYQPNFKQLIFQHQPLFWSSMSAGICTLTRRNASDAQFMRQLWSNKEFKYRFHRHASELPHSDEKLNKTLQTEFAALIGESRALHWIVRDIRRTPQGVLSLVDISLIHKKAELLLGVLPGSPLGLSVASMLITFQFFFNALRMNKLYVIVFSDNLHALKGVLHLGFKIEGEFKNELYDPRSNQLVDVTRLAINREAAFSEKNKRLMAKLLKAKLNEH
jgi:RimJ/RimL family protein N-acetyltransferase